MTFTIPIFFFLKNISSKVFVQMDPAAWMSLTILYMNSIYKYPFFKIYK